MENIEFLIFFNEKKILTKNNTAENSKKKY